MDSLLTQDFINRQNSNFGTIDENTVILIDESGMIGCRKVYHLLNAIKDSGAKVIFSGDSKQVLPIEAGQVSSLISEHTHATKIEMIKRQQLDHEDRYGNPQWRRDIVRMLLRGEGKQALDELNRRNHVHISDSNQVAMIDMVKQWYEQNVAGKESLMIATKNKDVQKISTIARAMCIQAGAIDENSEIALKTKSGVVNMGVGDRIRLGMNYRDTQTGLDISNGDTGVISTISKSNGGYVITYIDDASQQSVSIDTTDYMTSKNTVPMSYNYCSTIYSAQGKTVDDVMIYASEYMDRRLAYVACSRSRENMSIFAGREEWQSSIKSQKPWLCQQEQDDHVITDEMIMGEIGHRYSQPTENDLSITHLSEDQIANALQVDDIRSISVQDTHRYQQHYEKYLENYLLENAHKRKGTNHQKKTADNSAGKYKSQHLRKLKKIIEDIRAINEHGPERVISADDSSLDLMNESIPNG